MVIAARLALVLVAFFGLAAVDADAGPAVAAGPAQEEAPPTTLRELPEGAGRIIQQPNSGVAPEDSGDRGGSAQILLFVVLTAAVGGGVVLVVRESRRKRSEAG